MDYRLTDQARFEMECRGISETEEAQAWCAPERTDLLRPGRVV
jgi:hypothetical protein